MDLIDKRDAIRIVDSIDTWQAGWRGNAIESLKALPSAQSYDYSDGYADGYKQGQKDAQPERTGKWIDCDGSEHWKCDKCGCRAGYWFNEENSSSWELDMSEWLSDFCPNCGAKMENEK